MTRPLPPVYFLTALLTMMGLHYVVPGYRWIDGPLRYLGVLPVMAGFALVIYAAGLFRKRGTTIKPFQESDVLVVEGPYRFTRNPMYLSMVLILIGVAVLLGTVTCLLIPPVFVWLITFRFIRVEETMLTDRFGEQYLAYRERVRRWV